MGIGERLCGLDRARERTGIHGVYFLPGKALGDLVGLCHPGVIQWNIGATAKAFVFVPVSLAVTDEDKAGTYWDSFGDF